MQVHPYKNYVQNGQFLARTSSPIIMSFDMVQGFGEILLSKIKAQGIYFSEGY